MKTLFIILFSLFILGDSFSQNRELDSLYLLVKNSGNQKDIASAHGRLCWLLINSNIKDAQAHIDSARMICEKLNDKRGIAIADYKDGVISRKTEEFEKGLASIG
ncbi:MAG: hypothetical protein ACI8XB_001827 [Patiriisocius sp.]